MSCELVARRNQKKGNRSPWQNITSSSHYLLALLVMPILLPATYLPSSHSFRRRRHTRHMSPRHARPPYDPPAVTTAHSISCGANPKRNAWPNCKNEDLIACCVDRESNPGLADVILSRKELRSFLFGIRVATANFTTKPSTLGKRHCWMLLLLLGKEQVNPYKYCVPTTENRHLGARGHEFAGFYGNNDTRLIANRMRSLIEPY